MALVVIVVLVLVTHTKDIRKQSWTGSSSRERAGFDLAFYCKRLKMVVRTKVRVWRFRIGEVRKQKTINTRN